jgi:hypothetical protein
LRLPAIILKKRKIVPFFNEHFQTVMAEEHEDKESIHPIDLLTSIVISLSQDGSGISLQYILYNI